MSYTVPTFDEILNSILTDYRNLNGGVDVEVLITQLRAYQTANGSVPDISMETIIRSACQASALWGAYKYQEYLGKQPFPDTSDTDNLNHHGSVQGITRLAAETNAGYLARILDDIQNPSAGGNQYDYRQWAEAISGVARAHVYPLAQGDGTVDVVVVANSTTTGSELPSSSIRDGKVTSVTSNKLVDTAATFTTALAVSVGDIVRNTFQGTEAHVTAVDSATSLSLDADIFKSVGEHYHVHLHTGTSTTPTTANKLIDSAGAFTNATYNIRAGDVVKNITDNTQALVTAVDSATQLALDTDIFTATGKSYVVESLLARVKENIDIERPVTASSVEVLAPTLQTQSVTMSVSGTGVDKTALAQDITALIDSYAPNQILYRAQLIGLAIARGAENVSVTTPATDVTPTGYAMLRHGTITVT